MLGQQEPLAHTKPLRRQSIPPSRPKPSIPPPERIPLLERMVDFPRRKTDPGIGWLPEEQVAPPGVTLDLFICRNTIATADIILATAPLIHNRLEEMELKNAVVTAMTKSFRHLGKKTRARLGRVMNRLALEATKLIKTDNGRVVMLREALGETIRLGNYMKTDIGMHGNHSRFRSGDIAPAMESMFCASARIHTTLPPGSIADATAAIEGVVSKMETATCRKLLDAIAMADKKWTLENVIRKARMYANNESGLCASLDR